MDSDTRARGCGDSGGHVRPDLSRSHGFLVELAEEPSGRLAVFAVHQPSRRTAPCGDSRFRRGLSQRRDRHLGALHRRGPDRAGAEPRRLDHRAGGRGSPGARIRPGLRRRPGRAIDRARQPRGRMARPRRRFRQDGRRPRRGARRGSDARASDGAVAADPAGLHARRGRALLGNDDLRAAPPHSAAPRRAAEIPLGDPRGRLAPGRLRDPRPRLPPVGRTADLLRRLCRPRRLDRSHHGRSAPQVVQRC